MSRAVSDAFEEAAALTRYPRQLATLLASDPDRLEEEAIPVSVPHLAALADLAGEKTIGTGTARELLTLLWREDQDPREAVARLGLGKVTDRDALADLAREVIADCPRAAADFRAGKTAALQALLGQMMRRTQGRADPSLAREALLSLLLL